MSALKIDGSTVRALALEPWEPLPAVAGGDVGTRGQRTWRSPDYRVETGVWECDAGRFRVEFGAFGEFVHILSGEVDCTSDDGTTVSLAPGDTMTFEPGWSGEWLVREPLRKVYAGFRSA